MHGNSPGSVFLANAEVGSMEGALEGGESIGVETSLQRVELEKARAELRQEYDIRKERIREIEFLEKGGDPLDFKLGHAAPASVQSTSLTDQHRLKTATSEARGSFALTASPHGDSLESSGRPGGTTICEGNSADNLLLFDGENEIFEGKRNSKTPRFRSNNAPSEYSRQMDSNHNGKESEDSVIFRPYTRRNRSRLNRDGARSISKDVIPSHIAHVPLSVRHGLRDIQVSISETNNQKEQKRASISNPHCTSINGDIIDREDIPSNIKLDGAPSTEASTGLIIVGLLEGSLCVTASRDLHHDQLNHVPQADAQQSPINEVCGKPEADIAEDSGQAISAGERTPCPATIISENEASSGQLNGFKVLNRERIGTLYEGQSGCAAVTTLDSASPFLQSSISLDGNNESNLCSNLGYTHCNGTSNKQSPASVGTLKTAGGEMFKEKKEQMPVHTGLISNENDTLVHLNHVSVVKTEEELDRSKSGLQNESNRTARNAGTASNNHAMKIDMKKVNMLDDNSKLDKENFSNVGPHDIMEHPIHVISNATVSGGGSIDVRSSQSSAISVKVTIKAHEDSVLAEAQIIQAKRKRIAESSVRNLSSLENRGKSHWEFVLEEMAWLANDFKQERLWKITAAALVSRGVASATSIRLKEQVRCAKQRKVAFHVAMAVIQFWHAAELLLNCNDSKDFKHESVTSRRGDANEVAEYRIKELNMETNKEFEQQYPTKSVSPDIKGYAMRFLKYNRLIVPCVEAEASMSPDIMPDFGIHITPWEDHLIEESLFYLVPHGAMESYRKSVEFYLAQHQKTDSSKQGEVNTSIYEAVEELPQENLYDEYEGERKVYYLPGAFEGRKSLQLGQKKRNDLLRDNMSRSYDQGADLTYGQCTLGSQQSMLIQKRPADSLNVVSVPTKRTRTASRPRVLIPFSAEVTGNAQALYKTDASSGETSSLQDDQSTMHSEPQIRKSLEAESTADIEKQPFDYGEVSTKHKRMKYTKHLNSTFEKIWELDSTSDVQKEHSKKRMENHLESNGSNGGIRRHSAKKLKIMRQSLGNAFDNISPMTGSVSSLVASQMSNVSSPNKIMKLIGGRDRGRKVKALKPLQVPPGQPGTEGWSFFEDQALLVLVHDLGPNWELVSDSLNGTLQFMCIFRKPKECKERHKILMDLRAGDWADSAEDSGSWQSYPSTLPGIPKGSARQLFQRIQGPMEEDTLKYHFEKIILIGQRQICHRIQSGNQALKQIAPIHNSHVIALSQVCPNNLNGGLLTPLDLCDATVLSPDPFEHQGSQTSGFSHQGSVTSMIPGSCANLALQGSVGNNLSPPSGQINSSARFGVPRAALPVDEQQRLSGRNIQQSSPPIPGALMRTNHGGVHVQPDGNSMGMICGMNSRTNAISRPGIQGISSGGIGLPNPVNMHSGVGSGQGNSMRRPMQPGQNLENQRQMMLSEFQMQVSQGNGQGVNPFNGVSSNFSSPTGPPIGQTYPVHLQQPHQLSPEQSHGLNNSHLLHIQGSNHAGGHNNSAFSRLVRERQLQRQRIMQQQQQQFSASNNLKPQSCCHPSSSSSRHNSPKIQTQASVPVTQSALMTPMASRIQQQHQLSIHGLGLGSQSGANGLANQMVKQRQKHPQQQQFQQSGRHHLPPQHLSMQSLQQAKLSKGMGRGNTLPYQNLSVDPSCLNGISAISGGQCAEKGEQVNHLQGQSLYPGSNLNSSQSSRSLVPRSSNQSQLQQEPFPGLVSPSEKLQHMPSASSSPTSLVSHHAISATVMASNHYLPEPQQQSHQTQINLTPENIQGGLEQNRSMNVDLHSKSQVDGNETKPDQQPVNNIGSTNVEPDVSSSGLPQREAQDALCDSGVQSPASQLDSGGRIPLMNSSESGPVAGRNQGLIRRQLSGSLSVQGHNVEELLQQKTQLKQSVAPEPSQQQLE